MKSRRDLGNVPSWDEGAFEAMIRLEGFWRSSLNAEQDLPPGHEDEEDQHLPWPQPDATWSDRAAFLELLDCAEAGAQRSHEMGYSSCRLCGRQNGCETFELEEIAAKANGIKCVVSIETMRIFSVGVHGDCS